MCALSGRFSVIFHKFSGRKLLGFRNFIVLFWKEIRHPLPKMLS